MIVMKKSAFLIMALAFVSIVAAFCASDADADVTSGGMTFQVNDSTHQATLTGVSSGVTQIDASPFSYNGSVYTVTAVSEKALYSNKSVVSAYLPDVKSIGLKAFASCTSLRSLDLGDSSRSLTVSGYAFYNTSIDSIVLPSGTKTIGSYAFHSVSPSSVSVPSSVTTIGTKAFSGASFVDVDGVTAVPATAASLPGYDYVQAGSSLVRLMKVGAAFSSGNLNYKVTESSVSGVSASVTGGVGSPTSVSVPEKVYIGGVPVKVTSIAEKAFYSKSGLKSASIPYIEKIGSKAFASSGLTSVTMGTSVSVIGTYAFFKCPLVTLEIPVGHVSVGASAFSGCSSLTSVSIPGTGSTFGSNAFNGVSFYESDGVTAVSVNGSAFQGNEYSGTAAKMVKVVAVAVGTEFDSGSLRYSVTSTGSSPAVKVIGMATGSSASSLTVPSTVSYMGIAFSVTSIGSKTFYQSKTISSIDVGGVTSIGSKAFASSTLAAVVLGDELRTISAYAFYKCPLVDVEIPAGVDTIGSYAFYYCKSITHLDLPGTGYDFGGSVFTGLKFYEPDGVTAIAPGSPGFSGHSYSGSSAVLVMESDINLGDVFSISGLDYRVTSLASGAYAAEVAGLSQGSSLKNVVVPSSVGYKGCQFDVTAIGEKAFYRSTQITSLSLPDTVTAVKSKAFVSCTKLASVDLGSGSLSLGVDAFNGSSKVKSISFPSSLTIGTRALKGFSFFGPDGSSIPATAGGLGGSAFEGIGSSTLHKVITVSFLFCDNFENDGFAPYHAEGYGYDTLAVTVNPGIWVRGTGTTFAEALTDACSAYGIQVMINSDGSIVSIDDVVDGNIYIHRWDYSSSEWVGSIGGRHLTLNDLAPSDTDVAIVHGGVSDRGKAPEPRMSPDDRTWYFGDVIDHSSGTEVLFYLGDNFFFTEFWSATSTVDTDTLLVDGMWIKGYAANGVLSVNAFMNALDSLGYTYDIADSGWINGIGDADDGSWLHAVWDADHERWSRDTDDSWLGTIEVSTGLVMCIVHGAWGGGTGAEYPPYPEVAPGDMIWAF